MEILSPREVPLGGLRAMTVRRTLPQRQRSFIGAWCFLDHYGPDDVSNTGGMEVPPHPHTGLQTVSWLFSGEIEHRDSAGFHAFVRPGEMNLMTAGRGISHSEYSTEATKVLHGAQLWVVLPERDADTTPTFEHYEPTPVTGPGWQASVFLGSLLGSTSPVQAFTPLMGAEIRLSAGTNLAIDIDPTFEHGIMVDHGDLSVDGESVQVNDLAFLPAGPSRVELSATSDTLLLLIGGTPFEEEIIMWWNFIGRDHDEVVAYRQEWEDVVDALDGPADRRFSINPEDPLAALHAPPLPNVRLRTRG